MRKVNYLLPNKFSGITVITGLFKKMLRIIFGVITGLFKNASIAQSLGKGSIQKISDFSTGLYLVTDNVIYATRKDIMKIVINSIKYGFTINKNLAA